ncbi:hypothetical protein [Bacterioplanoides pacificum]|uniref:Uncharacterized protein n=1 Tax=Bacterioplanoides pacificum TaxID=1171596 RepID=A0ABV7VME7_9GAMM
MWKNPGLLSKTPAFGKNNPTFTTLVANTTSVDKRRLYLPGRCLIVIDGLKISVVDTVVIIGRRVFTTVAATGRVTY